MVTFVSALSLAATLCASQAVAPTTAPPAAPTAPSATAASVPPEAAVPAPTLAGLAAQIDALDQQIRVLERKLELEREAAAAAAQTTGVSGANPDGFALRSPDGNFVLRLRGLVHADGRFYAGDHGAATDTFVMRRVRPILDATLFSFVDARITPDFGGGTTVLQDAYIVTRFLPQLRVRAGKFKPPVGLERLVSASDILFVERGLPTGLVPNRDLGIMVEGDLAAARVLYQTGVFNGVVDGGLGDLDDRPGKDYAARLFVTPFKGRGRDRLEGLGLGLAGSAGTIDGVLAGPGLPTYRTAGQQVFFRYRLGTAPEATTVAAGSRRRISPQATYYSGRLGLLAEYVRSTQDVARGTDRATLDSTSWQIAGSWVLTGEPNTGRAVRPRAAFDTRANHYGAVELTARVNALTPDADAFPIFADPSTAAAAARGWSAGVNWYLNRALRITLDYEETRFRGGAAGRVDRPTERDLFTRFQVAF